MDMADTSLVLIDNPYEKMKALATKIHIARLELAKHPSYNNALTLQRLKHDRQAVVDELRGNMKLAYDFDQAVLNEIIEEMVA